MWYTLAQSSEVFVWDGSTLKRRRREEGRRDGQGVRQVGMVTNLHLLSVAIGNELLRWRLCAEPQP